MCELIDSKELIEALKNYFDNYDYHTKRIEELIKQWKEEDKG